MANKRSEPALKLPHSALSFQTLVSGAGTEGEPKRLPELTRSCEFGETTVTTVHRTEYTRMMRDTQNQRDLQKVSLEHSEETDQHKHLSKLLKTRGFKEIRRNDILCSYQWYH